MPSMQSKPMTPLSFATDRVPEEQLDKFLDRVNRVWRYAIEQGAELRPYSRHLELNALEILFLMSKYPPESDMPSESGGKLNEDKLTRSVRVEKPKTTEPSKEMKLEKPVEAIQELPARAFKDSSTDRYLCL